MNTATTAYERRKEDERIIRMEFTQQAHSKRLDAVEDVQVTFQEDIHEIKESIDRIKWICTGAVGFWVAQEFGLIKALKAIFAS